MLTSNIHHANHLVFYQFCCVQVSQKTMLVKGAEAKNIYEPPSKARGDICTHG